MKRVSGELIATDTTHYNPSLTEQDWYPADEVGKQIAELVELIKRADKHLPIMLKVEAQTLIKRIEDEI